MNRFRERKSWIVLMAVLLLFAACKGETPTAPPPGGGVPPGGTTPPTGATLTLTTTNSNPLVDSSVTITATATLNGAPVANGTAVEFLSTAGGSLNGAGTSIIRTTTNGAATVTLTATTAGLVRVSATVNNVTRTIDITFVARPIVDPPTGTTPSITSITPSIGRPSGGEVIRIVGTNFRSPVRVLFNTGGPLPAEGSVQSVSDTVIEVITPPVNLGSGQELQVDVIVLTQAGSVTEQRVELADGFTYRNQQLTPVIHTVTPNSGPVTGGTRVTILGEGFQEPVQVLFNTAEARILNVTFGQILVESPAARDTNPDGSGTVTGPVTVTVRNINSNTSGSAAAGFFYKAAMQITAAGPGSGLYTGGTRVSIDGIGFLGPVTVSVASFPAQVISVTGTKVIIITPAIPITACADVSGPIVVTNIANGDQATGPSFNFLVPPPFITNVSPAVATVGVTTSITVTVANAQVGVNRIRIGDKTVFPSSESIDPVTGIGTFVVPLPTNFEFPTEDCGDGGERDAPLDVDVTYLNANTGCSDTAPEALTVNPPSALCVEPDAPDINVVTPVPPACLVITPPDNTTPTNGTITIENTGTAPLTVAATASPASFTVLPPNASIPPGGSQNFVVTYNPGGSSAAVSGNVAFTSNDTDEPTVNVCLTGDAP